MSLVLEVGGSHVLGVLGDRRVHRSLDDEPDALAVLLDVVTDLGGRGGVWGVALPGPFDLAAGIGRYGGTGKLESLHDVDVRAALVAAGADDVLFLNDADAFALGAWVGSGRPDRLVGLTLGSGLGSGFVAAGRLVVDGPSVPEQGSVHLLQHEGAPLEQTFSRRALREAYRVATGRRVDVRDVCELARGGDPAAVSVLQPATAGLGTALRPWLQGFRAERLVVGGSIARSWDLLAPWFADGLDLPGLAVMADEDEQTALDGLRLALDGELHRDLAGGWQTGP